MITVERFGPQHAAVVRFCGHIAEIVDRAIKADEDVTFALDPSRIEGLVEQGLEHRLLEELILRVE